MSLNYPDRSKWLAVRKTPRNLKRGKMVHISTNYAWLPDNPLQQHSAVRFRKATGGYTYHRPADSTL